MRLNSLTPAAPSTRTCADLGACQASAGGRHCGGCNWPESETGDGQAAPKRKPFFFAPGVIDGNQRERLNIRRGLSRLLIAAITKLLAFLAGVCLVACALALAVFLLSMAFETEAFQSLTLWLVEVLRSRR